MPRLLLIPSHIGCWLDITPHSIHWIKRLRVLLTINPKQLEREMRDTFKIDCSRKQLIQVPQNENQVWLDEMLETVKREDMGLVASAGTCCVADPGHRLVSHLRSSGIEIIPLPGPSALTTLLSVSGVGFSPNNVEGFYFCFYNGESAGLMRALEQNEYIVILSKYGSVKRFPALIRFLIDKGFGARNISVFFDLTRFSNVWPYANKVLEKTCEQWEATFESINWNIVGEICFLVHPHKSLEVLTVGRSS